MERKPERLGLYLGSDEPINPSNLFSAAQKKQFIQVKHTRAAQFSRSDSSGPVAMFPDPASAQPCVDCHNKHPDSPQTDWKLHDVMGATTWTYPTDTITETELLLTTRALFASVAEAYALYLQKTHEFKAAVTIGPHWPEKDARVLPEVEVFMAAVLQTAGATLSAELLATGGRDNGLAE